MGEWGGRHAEHHPDSERLGRGYYLCRHTSITKVTLTISSYTTFFQRTVSIIFIPVTGNSFDDSCFTVAGNVRPHLFNVTSVSRWGDTALSYNTIGTYTHELTISSHSG